MEDGTYGKRLLGRPRMRWEDVIKNDVRFDMERNSN